MINNKSLISVIVPIYNVEIYLERCLDSIISQTYSNLEIVLVDDGSTDSSCEICDLYAKKDPRIKVIHKINGGLSDARNEGLKIATGDYIGFVDSDDWIDIDMFKILLKACQKNDVEISMCGYYKHFQNKLELVGLPKNMKISGKQAVRLMLKSKGELNLSNAVWYRLYKKQTLESFYFWKGHNNEDILYSTMVLMNSENCVYINKPLYHYNCMREDSIMKSKYSLKNIYDEIAMKSKRSRFLYQLKQDFLWKISEEELIHCLLLYHGLLSFNKLKENLELKKEIEIQLEKRKLNTFEIKTSLAKFLYNLNKDLFDCIIRIKYRNNKIFIGE